MTEVPIAVLSIMSVLAGLGTAAIVVLAWLLFTGRIGTGKVYDPVIRRHDPAEPIEPERDGQRVTRNPDSESHRRKTFSKKRRGGTEAHFSQPRRNW